MNLVEWLKKMVTNRNPEGVLDPKLPQKPTSRALKRALLVALRCVDPNAQKRPKMGHVVHMLEAEESLFKDVCMHFCLKINSISPTPPFYSILSCIFVVFEVIIELLVY